LKEKGFFAKNVINIIKRNKKPQALFKVELKLGTKALKKIEVHPIYKMKFLLHKRVTVKEPHMRKGPLQWTTDRNVDTLKTTVDFGKTTYLVEAFTFLKHAVQTKKNQTLNNALTVDKTIPQTTVYKELKNRL